MALPPLLEYARQTFPLMKDDEHTSFAAFADATVDQHGDDDLPKLARALQAVMQPPHVAETAVQLLWSAATPSEKEEFKSVYGGMLVEWIRAGIRCQVRFAQCTHFTVKRTGHTDPCCLTYSR